MQTLRAPSAARMTAPARPVALRAPVQARALTRLPARRAATVVVSASSKKNDENDDGAMKKQSATLAAAAFAAATLFLVPVDAAEAARSGGRVGGSCKGHMPDTTTVVMY